MSLFQGDVSVLEDKAKTSLKPLSKDLLKEPKEGKKSSGIFTGK